MKHFSEQDRKIMRDAQFNRCAWCHKEMDDDEGEAHEIFRSKVYKLNGVLLCKACNNRNVSYRPPLKVGDPLNPTIIID